MAEVGCWGTSIVFSTSDYRILTFTGFTRQTSSEWATHSRLGAKDQAEFMKPGLQKVSFKINLNAMNGIRPGQYWISWLMQLRAEKSTQW